MALFSFIDYGNKDFVKDNDGNVIRKQFANKDEAEDWLLSNSAEHDWTNLGVIFWNWDKD